MEKRISNNLNMFGFVMTCFIVLYHYGNFDGSIAISNRDFVLNSALNYVFNTIGTVAMSYFFCVTGFLLFLGLNKKTYFSKMRRRVSSLLVPYLVWEVIAVIADVAQKEYVFSFTDFLRHTFLLLKWPPDGVCWYIYAVFLMAIVSPVLLLVFKNKNIGWAITVLLVVVMQGRSYICAHIPLANDIYCYGYVGNIIDYLPCYLVGAFSGCFFDKEKPEKVLIYPLSLLVISLLMNGLFDTFFFNISLAVLPLFLIILFPSVKFLQNRRIYNLSFIIYAIHQLILIDVRKEINELFCIGANTPVTVKNITSHFFVISVMIIVSAIIYSVFKKFNKKGLSLLTGGRY